MIYFANPTTSARAAIDAGILGCMASPAQGNVISPRWTWAVDNDRFTKGADWSAPKWLAYLDKYAGVGRCVFAAVPDVVADAVATRAEWDRWSVEVFVRGYPLAYVAQDGETVDGVPWDELAVLFIGGTTAWKLGPDAMALAVEAQARGVWVHWGRVNSRRRFAMAAQHGDSCDGTFLTYAPDKNLPKLVGWLNTIPWSEAVNG